MEHMLLTMLTLEGHIQGTDIGICMEKDQRKQSQGVLRRGNMGTPVDSYAGSTSLLGASRPPKLKERLHLLGNHTFEVTAVAGGLSWGKGRSFSLEHSYALGLVAVPSGDTACSSGSQQKRARSSQLRFLEKLSLKAGSV